MKIKTITYESRNDFHAIMECEHCGAEQKNTSGYHDNYYHTQVIPGMFCKTCGRNRAGEQCLFVYGRVASSVYTCNGDPRGCERERFGNCTYHDNQ